MTIINTDTAETTKTKTYTPEDKGRSSFYIDLTVLNNAKAFAKANDISLSVLVERALRAYVDSAKQEV